VAPRRNDGGGRALSPAGGKPVVAPADLNGADYIGFDEDLSIRQALDRFFREHDIAINMAMQFDNIQMTKEAVALGIGHEYSACAHDAG